MDGSEKRPSVTLESLPNELLIHIASQLDRAPPSIIKFAHEPTHQLTEADSAPLKTLSCVSWRWRKIVLPLLFSYTRIQLDKEHQWVPLDARLLDSMQTQLATLSIHEFQIYSKLRSKFKTSSVVAYDQVYDDLLINLYRVNEEDHFLKSVPHSLWLPHLGKSFERFSRFVWQYELKHHIKSIVVYTDKEYDLRHTSAAERPLVRAKADIWSSIFAVLDPMRLVVAAPPTTLAALLDTKVGSSDAWAFEMRIHYIELRQSESRRRDDMFHHCEPSNSILIHCRPWSHLGYNEGSSVPAYRTYEYHLKRAPRMLELILFHLASQVKSCCNITSFAFVGVFPLMTTNFTMILRMLNKIDSINKVTLQLAPGPENNLLNEPERLGSAQLTDLWLEWNGNYKYICNYLSMYEFPHGSELRASDYQNKQLANEIDEHMDCFFGSGLPGWQKSNEEVGLWTRDHDLGQEWLSLAAFKKAHGLLLG